MKSLLVMRKSAYLELSGRLGILQKGGALPPGSIRVWGGTEYVKVAPGKRRRRVAAKEENSVENGDNTVLETDVEKALSDLELKKECLNYARQHFQGKIFTNKMTGREIKVSGEGLGEWKMKSKTREQVLSIKILDKLLENAAFDHDAPDEKGRANIDFFSYFTQQCALNGVPYMAIITIKKTKPCGDKYYHHYLEGIKIKPYSGTAPTLAG
jgi:hypothetical protein